MFHLAPTLDLHCSISFFSCSLANFLRCPGPMAICQATCRSLCSSRFSIPRHAISLRAAGPLIAPSQVMHVGSSSRQAMGHTCLIIYSKYAASFRSATGFPPLSASSQNHVLFSGSSLVVHPVHHPPRLEPHSGLHWESSREYNLACVKLMVG